VHPAWNGAFALAAGVGVAAFAVLGLGWYVQPRVGHHAGGAGTPIPTAAAAYRVINAATLGWRSRRLARARRFERMRLAATVNPERIPAPSRLFGLLGYLTGIDNSKARHRPPRAATAVALLCVGRLDHLADRRCRRSASPAGRTSHPNPLLFHHGNLGSCSSAIIAAAPAVRRYAGVSLGDAPSAGLARS